MGVETPAITNKMLNIALFSNHLIVLYKWGNVELKMVVQPSTLNVLYQVHYYENRKHIHEQFMTLTEAVNCYNSQANL